jgi:hypothetical protein
MAGLFYLLYRLFRHFFSPPPVVKEVEGGPTLVSCSQCDTWVPQESALRQEERIYCSQKCIDSFNEQDQV